MASLIEQIDKTQINEVIAFSQDIENPKTDGLLRDWSRAKEHIAKKFLGGKVSYRWPNKVRFELDENAKESKLNHFVEMVSKILNDWCHPLVRYLDKIDPNEFYNNSLACDYIIAEKDNKKILKGTKIIKSFKYFIDDIVLLQDLQNKASEIIQENKVEGYLTFSVHPLDFLSSSENTYNWRSCHSLDGECRAGNLSYMCDTGTIIVFLASEDNVQLPNFPPNVPWNNKKWRVLLHFDKELNVCFAGRQYPFFASGALEQVKEIFQSTMAPFKCSWYGSNTGEREKWSGWYNDYLENFERSNGTLECFDDYRYCIINKGIFDKYSIMHDAQGAKHFNDVLRSSCYEKPYYMYQKFYGPQDKIEFEVGSVISCLRCGEKIINGDDSMMCSDCECEFGLSESEEYRTCDCCGSRFWYNDGFWVEDDMICPHCEETQTFICEACGERFYNYDKNWDEELGGYICDACKDERTE